MRIRRILPFLLLPFLTGCLSAPHPVPIGYTGPLARIADTGAMVSGTKVHFFELQKIDGREVQSSSATTMRRNYGNGFDLNPVLESRDVPAGMCNLKLAGVTHVAADVLAFGGKMYFVSGEVPVTLEAGKKYAVKGVLSKVYSAVWLEDEAGNVVSPKIEKGTRPAVQ
jgi:hypothetical protein